MHAAGRSPTALPIAIEDIHAPTQNITVKHPSPPSSNEVSGKGGALHAPRTYGVMTRLLLNQHEENALLGKIVALIDPRPNENILDIGCGPGKLACKIKDTESTCNVSGADLSEHMVRAAAKNDSSVNFQVDDATKLTNFGDNSQDAVTMSLAMHHLSSEDITATLNTINRVLKPGGRVIRASCKTQRIGRFFCELSEDG